MTCGRRNGSANQFLILVVGAIVLLAFLTIVLLRMGDSGSSAGAFDASDTGESKSLFLYCAAGMRPPVEEIVKAYQKESGVQIQIQYGGSNTLLSQIEVAKLGDLYLAADDSYTDLAKQRGLVQETLPLARMRPVIVVPKGNPNNIRGIDDLLRPDLRTALGNPDQAAIGKKTRKLLSKSNHWDRLHQQVMRNGVFKPTVPEVANDVKLGSADAGIVWDTTLAFYPELEAVHVPELDSGLSNVTLGVLSVSERPAEALRFARYLAACDKGLETFQEKGFEVVDGDAWVRVPQLTFFCGSVNRRAVESVIKEFELREGVVVNTVYNGCGILTAQMRTIDGQDQGLGFPDTYMACDRFYLETVKDWFQDEHDISDTDVVIAVPKGNPANIQSLQDLTMPGRRVAVGQPDQCTIGILTRQVLEAEDVYDAVMKNVVTQTATSSMLIPTVTTKSVDAALAYATDTKSESDKVDVIHIDSPAAKAVQPYAIARSSHHKFLGRRLFQALFAAREQFEAAGFHFRLDDQAGNGTTVIETQASGE